MKLCNKKTGEIIEYDEEVIYYRKLTPNGHEDWTPYRPEDWEDYEPAEPLIKDEKVRKAVRAWADVNGDTRLYYHRSTNEMCANDNKGYVIRSIKFKFEFRESIGLESGWYTITELCGEEE